MIAVQIAVPDEDAVHFTGVLNEDGGFREAAVHKLLQQNKTAGIARYTAFVAVLGQISRAFTLALEANNLVDLDARRAEIRQLAGIKKAA